MAGFLEKVGVGSLENLGKFVRIEKECFMSEVKTKQETIAEIVREAKKLDKLELQILLAKLRVKKMRKDGVRPAARPRKGVKPPTMEEIDLWKHESRKIHAGK
jgi:hypothetical protein